MPRAGYPSEVPGFALLAGSRSTPAFPSIFSTSSFPEASRLSFSPEAGDAGVPLCGRGPATARRSPRSAAAAQGAGTQRAHAPLPVPAGGASSLVRGHRILKHLRALPRELGAPPSLIKPAKLRPSSGSPTGVPAPGVAGMLLEANSAPIGFCVRLSISAHLCSQSYFPLLEAWGAVAFPIPERDLPAPEGHALWQVPEVSSGARRPPNGLSQARKGGCLSHEAAGHSLQAERLFPPPPTSPCPQTPGCHQLVLRSPPRAVSLWESRPLHSGFLKPFFTF